MCETKNKNKERKGTFTPVCWLYIAEEKAEEI